MKNEFDSTSSKQTTNTNESVVDIIIFESGRQEHAKPTKYICLKDNVQWNWEVL